MNVEEYLIETTLKEEFGYHNLSNSLAKTTYRIYQIVKDLPDKEKYDNMLNALKAIRTELSIIESKYTSHQITGEQAISYISSYIKAIKKSISILQEMDLQEKYIKKRVSKNIKSLEKIKDRLIKIKTRI